MANQARQSPPETANTASPVSNSIHNTNTSYYHHYHHSSSAANTSNAGYSPQNTGLNGNESPNSVDQFTSGGANNNNNIQLPETPNSLVGTTLMGPTSGNSNSNDATNAINESASETASNNNNNYNPWCSTTTSHHQLPLSNSPIHSSSYNTAHHPSASLYSAAAAAHHNLLPHQNISSFVQHPSQKGFNHHLPQSFYSWY